jgi:release factor glutamine methyltransferase
VEHLKKHGIEAARLEAEILLSHAMNLPRIQLYARYQQVLTGEQRAQMRDLVQRRVKHEPVAYLVGYREFLSLKFLVNGSVLIPRPDTETLVLEVLSHLKSTGKTTSECLDLCTGSGCLGIACAKQIKSSHWTLIDCSPEALDIAKKNVDLHELNSRVNLLASDLFAKLPAGTRFDVIVTNPPYIATAEIDGLDPDVREYEPHLALDGGPDGLALMRRIAECAPQYLKPGGLFICEYSPEQVTKVEHILNTAFPQSKITMLKDSSGLWRAGRCLLPQNQ